MYPRVSPDGQRVALDTRDVSSVDIWIWDLQRQVLTRLTTDPARDLTPVWTPDGRRIAYSSDRGGAPNLFWQASDGTGTAERLTTSLQVQAPAAFTPDGKSLILRDTDPKTGADIALMTLEGERTPKPLIHSRFDEANAELSPDGRWIAYQSNESGRAEVHVRPFPKVDSGHWQISTNGGSQPLWARSGRELFFVDASRRIIAVPIQTGPSFTAGNTTVAVAALSVATAPGRAYDVSPDGKRFLVIQPAGADDKASQPQLNVVLNWGDELTRLLPAKK
jgi:serine/threonine-protein kinase